MSGEFKMTLELHAAQYVLNRDACELLLEKLDTFGDDCGHPCKRMREDLRAALAADEAARVAKPVAKREPEVEVRTTLDAQPEGGGEPENAPAGDGTPRCGWCEEDGEPFAADDDGRPRWVCRTDGCPRRGKPAGREAFCRLFGGGIAQTAKSERGGGF